MNKEFIPYEQALELKELGFNEPCMGYFDTRLEHQIGNFDFTEIKGYNESVSALSPLYQQAFRWFREKCPDFDFGVGKIYNGSNTYHYHINLSWEYFEGTYEEAELACLNKLIELVKNK
jgi:hypothetical protein